MSEGVALLEGADARTLEILEHRRGNAVPRRRGWIVRRALLAADVAGLASAFVVAQLVFGADGGGDNPLSRLEETLLVFVTLPGWIVAAKLYGLYDRDEERADHSTADEVMSVLHFVTAGAWTLFVGFWLTGLAMPQLDKLLAFWAGAAVLVAAGRSIARGMCRRRIEYVQNAVIVGAGDIGQLVARKFLQHHEYGINVVGFVDERPKERRADLGHLCILGGPEDLCDLIETFDIERVIVAFSNEPEEAFVQLVRSLSEADVQVDIVPRLFDVVGPKIAVHAVEGLPLIGLPARRIPRSSRLLKRAVDVVGASVALVLTAPLFALIAWRVRRDSPGPVFFRQRRLGEGLREFSVLKFRTMTVGTRSDEHEQYIARTMSAAATPEDSGLYKLERAEVTPFGRWLRKTSLDELPQLINVLRGDMSLVGPRPCIEYETAHFEPHHFDRFAVPAGITGMWQVTARAHSTFGEALDLDVLYARSWSLALDVRLLLRTPITLLRQRKGTT